MRPCPVTAHDCLHQEAALPGRRAARQRGRHLADDVQLLVPGDDRLHGAQAGDALEVHRGHGRREPAAGAVRLRPASSASSCRATRPSSGGCRGGGRCRSRSAAWWRCSSVFWLWFQSGSQWASTGFYFFGLILGILVISQFWTLANEVYDPRQAKRIFGFIGGGSSLGGIAGSSLTLQAKAIGTTNLLLVSAALIGAVPDAGVGDHRPRESRRSKGR